MDFNRFASDVPSRSAWVGASALKQHSVRHGIAWRERSSDLRDQARIRATVAAMDQGRRSLRNFSRNRPETTNLNHQ